MPVRATDPRLPSLALLLALPEARRQRSGVDRTAALLRDLEAFEPPDEESRALLRTMLAFVRSASDPLSRTSSTSHVTASAVIARPDGR